MLAGTGGRKGMGLIGGESGWQEVVVGWCLNPEWIRGGIAGRPHWR